MGIVNVEANKMENTNYHYYYLLRFVLNYSKSVSHETLLKIADQVVRTTSTASIVNDAEQVFLQSGRTVY